MQRLQTRTQFQAVLAGAIIAKTTHFALHRNSLDARPVQAESGGPVDAAISAIPAKSLFPVQDTWLGAMVPKRWAKRAVTRNAIKRVIREAFRHRRLDLPAKDYVVRLHSKVAPATLTALKRGVRAEVDAHFGRIAR